jgi:hypothetical protein
MVEYKAGRCNFLSVALKSDAALALVGALSET